MKITLNSFYSSFYGNQFYRHFRRIPYSDNPHIRKQFFVTNPKQLLSNISKNKGIYPSFISTYNYGDIDCLKKNVEKNIVFDRLFFDFDTVNLEFKKTKDELTSLLSKGLNEDLTYQKKLKKALLDYIINKEMAKESILEAKNFAYKIESEFGNLPALFFSGSKGAHAYTFFEPIKLVNSDKTISHFSLKVKENFEYDTMDLSVSKNALKRVSRVPYSTHNLTGLKVVPFSIDDDYEDILNKSQNPLIEKFDVFDHITDLGNHLEQIDEILTTNMKIKSKNTKKTNFPNSNNYKNHLRFFQKILGEPQKIYDGYVMYNCPFPDHEDTKPSFLVNESGYGCYGCGKKGNYWQFLKDYYGYSDEQIRSL